MKVLGSQWCNFQTKALLKGESSSIDHQRTAWTPIWSCKPTGERIETRPANHFDGIFLLLILNIGIYVADHILQVSIGQASETIRMHRFLRNQNPVVDKSRKMVGSRDSIC
jgi:hypothetical protein